MTKVFWLRAKTSNYLTYDSGEYKKAKDTETSVRKKKLKFGNYKNCLKVTQFKNKMNHLEKNQIDIDSIKRNHKELKKTINLYCKHNIDLKGKDIVFLLKKLIRFHSKDENKFKWWKKNSINLFNRNICVRKKQSFNNWKRRD